MFYVDSYSFVRLGNTTELNDLFCQFSSEWYLRRNFLIKVAGCSLPTPILPKMNFFGKFFFKFLTKSVDKSFLDSYFYLLLSLKQFSRKKSVLLKLTHLITLLPRLDQSNEIYFVASWWALIIKARCNVVPLYCSLILRSNQRFTLSNGAIIGKDRLQVD